MTDVKALVNRYRTKGLFVDTNLLILYLVGKANPHRVAQYKRTRAYTEEDFHLIDWFVNQFSLISTTPHVLTEVSNLATPGRETARVREHMRALVGSMAEHYFASSGLTAQGEFVDFGLTDTAILRLAGEDLLFLTDDLDLFLALEKRNAASINFHHLRGMNWFPTKPEFT
jgi:hypothetical protein